MQRTGGETISHLTNRTEKLLFDQRKTYTHTCAPTDLPYESRGLMAENNNVYETIWKKTEIIKKNIMKNTFVVVLL